VIGFLMKGLLRDRHRSLFPLATIVLGVALTVVLHCWITGFMRDMLDSSARFSTGHVKVVTHAYAELSDLFPNDLALIELEGLLAELEGAHPDVEWQPRILFGGLLDVPDERGETRAQSPVSGWGVDLLQDGREVERLNLASSLERGRLPAASDEILISDDLALRLAVEPGSQVTLFGSTMHGGMALYNFTIAGTVRFGIAAMDRGSIVADLAGVQEALDMVDAAGEIFGFFDDGAYHERRAAGLADEFNGRQQEGEFEPTMLKLTDQQGLASMLDYMTYVSAAMIAIFVGAMAVVLWNSGLIGGIRRYGEVGVRLAIGESKPRVYRAMVLESVLLGLVGSAIGTAVGLAVSYFFQEHGIDFGQFLQDSSIMMSGVYRAQITSVSWVVGFVPGLFATVLGTALSGVGILKRNTAELFKELET
jgi:putative ABC transport system permease protein